MRILIIGSGSREHALAWHFRQDPTVKELFIAPGNAGTAMLGINIPLTATDLTGLTEWARRERPHLTFVGPEAPLCLGIVDAFQADGLSIFGPNLKAARLEASKIFTKELLLKYKIPTGKSCTFYSSLDAHIYSQKQPYPQVIKADGLAAGKGVVIAQTPEQASTAINDMMEKRVFGKAGSKILIEEHLVGQEISILALTDGKSFKVLPAAQDHKRLLDGDMGPNTGGMGAYAPAPFYTADLADTISKQILQPTLDAFHGEDIDYQGILFVGIMLTADGPKVLEFNVRLGDPETQVVLPLLETPLYQISQAIFQRRLSDCIIKYKPMHAVGIVLAASNYPVIPRSGDVIKGLDQGQKTPNTMVFHGGTKMDNAQFLTAGGRVLTATAWAPQLQAARDLAYQTAAKIQFEGVHYRRDIGSKSLAS